MIFERDNALERPSNFDPNRATNLCGQAAGSSGQHTSQSTPSSQESTTPRAGDKRARREHVCHLCQFECSTSLALRQHTDSETCVRRQERIAAMNAYDNDELEDEVRAEQQRVSERKQTADAAEYATNMRHAQLNKLTDLRFESYVDAIDIQRAKEMASNQMEMAKTFIVRELRAAAERDSFDGLEQFVETVMNAGECIKTQQTETSMRRSQYDGFVEPIKRYLGETGEEVPSGEKTRSMYTYDIPLEATLGRELMYDASFAQWFCDFPTVNPPSSNGVIGDIGSGEAIKRHAVLGKKDYTGPARLAFAAYVDDVEVVMPIGAARGKHKVCLVYPEPH